MRSNTLLIVTSLISILLMSLHIAEDIVLGFSGGGLANMFAIAILAVYLCGALLWSDRRVGLIIILVGSLLALVMPVLHMMGAGVGVRRSAGAFFFVWTRAGSRRRRGSAIVPRDSHVVMRGSGVEMR